MQYRILPGAAAMIIAIAAVAEPTILHAQAAAASARTVPIAVQLRALSMDRAARWASAAPVIHCGPAPLTERPGVAAEFDRPHIAPLEASFLDATIVKRTVAARTGSAAGRPALGSD